MIKHINYSIHTQKTRIIFTINTRKLTLVGSVGPCRTNKEAFKRNLQKRRFDHTHRIHELQFISLLQKTGVQSTVFKNQSYNITMLNYISVYLSSTRLSLLKRNNRYNQSLEITSNVCTNITIG
jgi:hypothetical protein